MSTQFARTGYLGFVMPSATRDEALDGVYNHSLSFSSLSLSLFPFFVSFLPNFYHMYFSFLLSFSIAVNNLFVIGSVDESLTVRGYRYHPVDLEATVIRCHKNVINRLGSE